MNWVVTDILRPIQTWDIKPHNHDESEKADTFYLKYPGVLGRLPLFLPLKTRQHIKGMLSTSWGNVEFTNNSQPLTIGDEDLFIQILNLATVFDKEWYHYKVTITDQNRENVTALIQHTVKIFVKYEKSGYVFEHNGSLLEFVQGIDPNKMIVRFKSIFRNNKKMHLRNLDMLVRDKLSYTGKALFRFIVSQNFNGKYSIEIVKKAVAPYKRDDHFITEIQSQMARMKEQGFLEAYNIVGRKNKTIEWKRHSRGNEDQ